MQPRSALLAAGRVVLASRGVLSGAVNSLMADPAAANRGGDPSQVDSCRRLRGALPGLGRMAGRNRFADPQSDCGRRTVLPAREKGACRPISEPSPDLDLQ